MMSRELWVELFNCTRKMREPLITFMESEVFATLPPHNEIRMILEALDRLLGQFSRYCIDHINHEEQETPRQLR